LEDVDWHGLFSSFYEIVRMKIKCRDSTKIPNESLFSIDKKLYKIAITVERPKGAGGSQGSSRGDDDDKGDDNGEDKYNFDDVDDLDEEDVQNDKMNLDKKCLGTKCISNLGGNISLIMPQREQ
jgi:hypothetical protein